MGRSYGQLVILISFGEAHRTWTVRSRLLCCILAGLAFSWSHWIRAGDGDTRAMVSFMNIMVIMPRDSGINRHSYRAGSLNLGSA